jgi:hypothetical protein
MPELIIRLVVDRETGKKNIIVKLESDPDALPMEHEEHHRELVEKLLGKGVLKREEVGQVIVERESDIGEATKTPAPTAAEQRRREAEGH